MTIQNRCTIAMKHCSKTKHHRYGGLRRRRPEPPNLTVRAALPAPANDDSVYSRSSENMKTRIMLNLADIQIETCGDRVSSPGAPVVSKGAQSTRACSLQCVAQFRGLHHDSAVPTKLIAIADKLGNALRCPTSDFHPHAMRQAAISSQARYNSAYFELSQHI